MGVVYGRGFINAGTPPVTSYSKEVLLKTEACYENRGELELKLYMYIYMY